MSRATGNAFIDSILSFYFIFASDAFGALLGGVQNDKVHYDFAICCLFCMAAKFSTKLHSLEMEFDI